MDNMLNKYHCLISLLTLSYTLLASLKHQTHRVYIKDTLSERHNLNCGVPQGSVLGARRYIMYAYLLCTIMNEHNLHYHSSADDKRYTQI